MSPRLRCAICGRAKPRARFADPDGYEMCYLCERLEEGGFLVEVSAEGGTRRRVVTAQKLRELQEKARLEALLDMARGF